MSNNLVWQEDKHESRLDDPERTRKNSRFGLWIGGTLGFAGLALVAISTPFVLPALRKHCLPYVPATDRQISNLREAFIKHAKSGDRFLDIGSGDGRICREAARLNTFPQVHGVELNYPLVLYSRIMSLGDNSRSKLKFFHRDLWKFPLGTYDSICIFGVESMMDPLQKYMLSQRQVDQTVFACRFRFKNLEQVDEIGEGIDTVWIYKIPKLTPRPGQSM